MIWTDSRSALLLSSTREALADGILAVEELADERLVDDGHPLGGVGVLRGESAAKENGDAHSGKEVVAYVSDVGDVGAIVAVSLYLRGALDIEVFAGTCCWRREGCR